MMLNKTQGNRNGFLMKKVSGAFCIHSLRSVVQRPTLSCNLLIDSKSRDIMISAPAESSLWWKKL